MKYTIRENPDGTHTLLRYGEPVTSPNNCEFEFWQRIQKLEEGLKEIETRVSRYLVVDTSHRLLGIRDVAREALKDD
jgi:hypothetical protein